MAELQQYLKPKMLEKYEQFAYNNFTVCDPNEIPINCPSKKCTARFVIWKDADFTTCPICKFKFCVRCKNEFHPKLTCQQKTDSLIDAGDK